MTKLSELRAAYDAATKGEWLSQHEIPDWIAGSNEEAERRHEK